MKKFIKLMAMLAVPALLAGGSLTLTGCSSDALTGPVVMDNGSNSGGSTTVGGSHNEYNGGNSGGSTTVGGSHNN